MTIPHQPHIALNISRKNQLLASVDHAQNVSTVLPGTYQHTDRPTDGRTQARREGSHLAPYGLRSNGKKSWIIICSQNTKDPPKLRQPLLVGGEAVPEAPSLRYLGVLFDRRLSFGPHWSATAASAKQALGAIGALVRWEPRIMRHLVSERVLPLLLYSLAPCLPTTKAAWAAVDSVISYAAHRLTNSWDSHGEENIRQAGLPTARDLAARGILSLAADSVLHGRRFGHFIDAGLDPTEPMLERPYLPRPGLRSAPEVAPDPLYPEWSRPFLIRPLNPRYATHKALLPAKISTLWNEALVELGPAPLATKRSSLKKNLDALVTPTSRLTALL